MSVFRKWFEQQHGKRPVREVRDNLLRETIREGVRASATLQKCIEWDQKRRSALYAWQVEDSEK